MGRLHRELVPCVASTRMSQLKESLAHAEQSLLTQLKPYFNPPQVVPKPEPSQIVKPVLVSPHLQVLLRTKALLVGKMEQSMANIEISAAQRVMVIEELAQTVEKVDL